MSRKTGKKRHTLLIVLAILLAVLTTAALILMTHTQIIVGTIQKLSASTVNTINSYDPLGEPMEGLKDNGQYIITEIKYSENYPNSFLDITYPDENRETARPTLIYFHGGGFFGGSKSAGDPLAESDATALLDDICTEGFNLVNIDYVLVPEYHFPAPLIQANEAFQFLIDHADEYHLDMDRVVIMGSSAGAIMTSQLGSIITNPDYAESLGISPAMKPKQIKAVALDDAPLVYDKFSLGTNDRVSGKTADRLRDDQVDFPGEGIGYHGRTSPARKTVCCSPSAAPAAASPARASWKAAPKTARAVKSISPPTCGAFS